MIRVDRSRIEPRVEDHIPEHLRLAILMFRLRHALGRPTTRERQLAWRWAFAAARDRVMASSAGRQAMEDHGDGLSGPSRFSMLVWSEVGRLELRIRGFKGISEDQPEPSVLLGTTIAAMEAGRFPASMLGPSTDPIDADGERDVQDQIDTYDWFDPATLAGGPWLMKESMKLRWVIGRMVRLTIRRFPWATRSIRTGSHARFRGSVSPETLVA